MNYYPYMIIDDIEHMGAPMSCAEAYDEAVRFKNEYNPTECGIRVCIPDALIVKSWKDGICHRLTGAYLYKISV